MIVCTYCGCQTDDNSRFCMDCGRSLVSGSGSGESARGSSQRVSVQPAVRGSSQGDAPPPAPAAAVPPTRVSPQVSGARSTCPQCDTPNPPEFKFCGMCGAVLDPSQESEPGQTAVLSAKRADHNVVLALLDESGAVKSRHPLAGTETTIGREEGADILFPEDPYLSPIHSQIVWHEGQLTVRDLGSRNGTWVFLSKPHRLADGDQLLVGSQVIRFRRLGYPGPHPPEADATKRMGSLTPSADIAVLCQLRGDGSQRDVLHLSPGRDVVIGREEGDWIFPYDQSMSGQHASIRSEDADFVIMDAGSRNGVALAVRGEMEVRDGSKMLLGDKLFVLEGR